MYAVIRDGGRQHLVREGDNVWLDLKSDAEAGSTLELTDVLLVGDEENVTVGQPVVEGAAVLAKVEGTVKDRKTTVLKFRRRKDSKTKQGHRQKYTAVTIDEIKTA